MGEEKILDIPVSEMGESFGRFRLIHPAAEVSVLESVRRFGLILPVVVVAEEDGAVRYELVDGFKRLRACRELGLKTILASVLSLGVRPAKAAILQLNWKAKSIREMEEAMIVQSLHREDNLSQVDIAHLLGRHKSWVCRRIALVEKLCNEVLYHLKLGLISAGQGRHLTRLPHGNQEQALSAILRHRLCCRETEKLVAVLIERPKREHAEILHLPLEILKNRSAPSFSGERKAARQGEPTLAQRLRDLDENHREFSCVLDARLLEPLSPQEREILSVTTESVQKLLDRMKKLCAAEAP